MPPDTTDAPRHSSPPSFSPLPSSSGYDRERVLTLASPGFDAEVDGNEIKWGVAARVKAGRKFGDGGRWLAFGSAGFGRAKTEQIGSGRETATNGYLYGLGVAYLLKDNIAISGEFVHVEKNGDNDADADGAMLGISYKF